MKGGAFSKVGRRVTSLVYPRGWRAFLPPPFMTFCHLPILLVSSRPTIENTLLQDLMRMGFYIQIFLLGLRQRILFFLEDNFSACKLSWTSLQHNFQCIIVFYCSGHLSYLWHFWISQISPCICADDFVLDWTLFFEVLFCSGNVESAMTFD